MLLAAKQPYACALGFHMDASTCTYAQQKLNYSDYPMPKNKS